MSPIDDGIVPDNKFLDNKFLDKSILTTTESLQVIPFHLLYVELKHIGS